MVIFLQFTPKNFYNFSLPLQTSYTNKKFIIITTVTEPAVCSSEIFWQGRWCSVFNMKGIFVA